MRGVLLVVVAGGLQQLPGLFDRDRRGSDEIGRPDGVKFLGAVDFGHDETDDGFDFHCCVPFEKFFIFFYKKDNIKLF